nr:MAG TPA: hypothetical protein [Caudoviricetes sp.]
MDKNLVERTLVALSGFYHLVRLRFERKEIDSLWQ